MDSVRYRDELAARLMQRRGGVKGIGKEEELMSTRKDWHRRGLSVVGRNWSRDEVVEEGAVKQTEWMCGISGLLLVEEMCEQQQVMK